MLKNKLGEDSPIPKFIPLKIRRWDHGRTSRFDVEIMSNLKIRRRDGIESLTTLEEGEFKVPIDNCISKQNQIKTNLHVKKFVTSLLFTHSHSNFQALKMFFPENLLNYDWLKCILLYTLYWHRQTGVLDISYFDLCVSDL